MKRTFIVYLLLISIMGWDLLAYFHVDQESLEQFVCENNLDRTDHNDGDIISAYFMAKHLVELTDQGIKVDPLYSWNQDCDLHEVFDMYRISSVPDDDRLYNTTYHKQLEAKTGKPFPICLKHMYNISTPEQALEVAQGIRDFFSNDTYMLYFAEWLEWTAKYCDRYELSY